MYPDKPVILGGWHPSLLPDQTLAVPYIDAVVKGQGEEAMLEIVQHIEAGESLKGIQGVGYKEDGGLVFNAPRALKPIRELPPKAYHLANFDAYERVCGRRWAMYTFKPGVPLSIAPIAQTRVCTAANGMRWKPVRLWKKTTDLVSRYRLKLLWIVDDNFLVDRERAVGIAEGLCDRGVQVRLEHSGFYQSGRRASRWMN